MVLIFDCLGIVVGGWWLVVVKLLDYAFHPKIDTLEQNAWELTYTTTGTPSKDEQALFSLSPYNFTFKSTGAAIV
jgi:hypothetical protein